MCCRKSNKGNSIIPNLSSTAESMPVKCSASFSKTIIFGLLLIVLGTCVIIFQPSTVYRRSKLVLSENSESLKLWQATVVKPVLKMHVFNITNAEAFLAGREKLHVEDVGPYIYEEDFEFHDPKFNTSEGTVTVKPTASLTWVSHSGSRSEDEIVVLPNMIMLLMAQYFGGSAFFRPVINQLITQTRSEPIIKTTVRDLMFGSPNTLMSVGNTLFPFWLKFNKLGLMDRMCDFEGETMTSYTGEKNYHDSGRMARLNGLSELPYWDAPCGRIQGSTDGKKFGNDIDPNETLYFYRKFACRAIPLVQAGPSTFSNQGLPTVPYKLRDDALDNGQKYPENKCFCRFNKCLPSGLADTSPCFYGFSTSLSKAHFYDADPSLLENITGLYPNKSLHDSIVYINPETGILTNFTLRFQFNLVLHDINDVNDCGRFSNMVVPMTWADTSITQLEPSLADKIYFTLRILPIIYNVFAAGCLLIGSFSIVFYIFNYYKRQRRRFDEKQKMARINGDKISLGYTLVSTNIVKDNYEPNTKKLLNSI